MGNCGNKPLTAEGETPAPPVEAQVDQSKDEEKKPEEEGEASKSEEVAKEVIVETTEEAPKP